MKEQKPSSEETSLQIRLSQTLNVHTAPVYTVRFSSDCRTLVSSDGKQMVFWDKEGHLFQQSQVLDIPSSQVRFSFGGERLAVVGTTPNINHHLPSIHSVHLCNSLGEEVSEVPLAFDAYALAFDPNNRFLAIADTQGSVYLWGLEEQEILTELRVAPKRGFPRLISISISEDGSLLAVGYYQLQGSALLYTLPRSEQDASSFTIVLKGTFGTRVSYAHTFAFSHDQRFFASAPVGDVEIYDPSSLAFITRLSVPAIGKPPKGDTVKCLTFSPDNRYLAAATIHGMVYIWELATFQLVTSFAAHTDFPLVDYLSSLIGDIDWSPDGKWLVTSGVGWLGCEELNQPPYTLTDYSVKIWKVKKNKTA